MKVDNILSGKNFAMMKAESNIPHYYVSETRNSQNLTMHTSDYWLQWPTMASHSNQPLHKHNQQFFASNHWLQWTATAINPILCAIVFCLWYHFRHIAT